MINGNVDSRLKQRYVEIAILCDLAPPTVSERKTNVINTNPKSVTIDLTQCRC